MVLPAVRPGVTDEFTSAIPGWPSRSVAVRAAAEAFVYSMHRCRVQQYDVVAQGWIHATEGEIVRRFRMAPAFWPLTVKSDEATLTGYGVNAHAVVIRYAQRVFPLAGVTDGFTTVRTEFGPGCRDSLRRASGTVPAFVCEPLSPRDAQEVVRAYLIDAAMSLAEGRGPLVVAG
jgi:hypothetical protein